MTQHGALPHLDASALDASDTDAADIFVIFNIADQELQRLVHLALGSGDLADDRVKQRLHIRTRLMGIERRKAVAGGSVNNRELQLVVIGAQLDKQIKHLVDDLLGSSAVAVDLVDDDEGLFSQAQRLFEHKARLRHASLKGVHQQQNAVHHHQDALHLAAEISVAGSVDDIDLGVMIHDGGVLRQDGDTALTLKVVGVHHALVDNLVGAEDARLAQQLVDQRGLAVVDVSDDRDIA